MNMDSGLTIAAVAAFFGAMLLCGGLLKLGVIAGRRFGLVDRPNDRKLHIGDIPLVGGASIFITFFLLHFNSPSDYPIIFASGFLLLVGVADDYLDLGAKSRLICQAIAASILVVAGGYQITSLDGLLPDNLLLYGAIGTIAFSIVCVIGVINAINMIDGADGLAGGVVTISVTALLIAAVTQSADAALISGLLVVLGATFAFLLFNSGALGEGQRVFLGDSGSMFLGALLASYYIAMSQGDHAFISPVVSGWIFGLPLMDSISVMVGRMLKGKSPLTAGRDHLHHRLMRAGMRSGKCVATMLAIHAALVLTGILGNHFEVSAQLMFWSFAGLVVAHHYLLPVLISRILNEQAVE